MKEKIGMEKLLELLNEYEDVKTWYATYTTRGEQSEREIKSDYMFDEDQNIIQIYIISKDFGFIKWLVENDKIDLEAQAIQYAKSDLSKFFAERKDKNGMSDDYAMLLMLLAIQDEPIRFLCEILK